MPSWINRTFAGGEIAPSLQVRGDQVKYQTGINLGKNLTIRRDGTAWNRQGTGYIDTVDDSTKKHRCIDWVFNNNLSYVLELGDLTMRFIKNGAQVLISAPAAYNGGTTYAFGDFVADGGINYYSLHSDNIGNTPAANPTWWYALTGLIMEIPTPWTEDDIFAIKYDQQGDVMHLVHGDNPPQKLARTSDTGWTMTDYRIIPDLNRAAQMQLLATTAVGTLVQKYKATLVSMDYEESLPITCSGTIKTITSITAANPMVVTTSAAHGYVDGDEIILFRTDIPEIENRSFFITNKTATTFELQEEDGTGYIVSTLGTFASSSNVFALVTAGTPTLALPTTVSLSSLGASFDGYVSGDLRHVNIYKDIGQGYGFIGTIALDIIDASVSILYLFEDSGIEPDRSIQPPRLVNYFQKAGDYPSTVQFYQQRLAFGASNNQPQTIWLSRIGFYSNFTTSDLLTADDAINFIVSGRTIEKVEHLVDATTLLSLTQGGEWQLRGDENGTIRATSINAGQIGFEGADPIQPIVIGNTVIYMQARSRLLRAIGFNENIRGYDPDDLSRWANHLFEDKKVVDWSYQKLPDSVFWIVMDDGTVVSMTFVIDEAIIAFTRHETDGFYESVCVVPEGDDDIPYFVVHRNVNGSSVRYTERMPKRDITDMVNDAYFMDSFVTYDGTNTTAITMTLSGGPPWDYTDGPFTLDASAAYFAGVADVGDSIVLTVGTDSLVCTISQFNSTIQVLVNVNKEIPVAFQGVAMTTWGRGIKTFTGLGHLEAKTVAVLADGNVLTQELVASAAITVDDPYVVVRIGIPYLSDLETLDVELAGAETYQDRKKRVNNMTIVVKETRGGWAGPDGQNLIEMKQLLPDDWNTVEEMLVTDRIETILTGSWQEKGKLYIQQRDPLPMHILGLIPHGIVGG